MYGAMVNGVKRAAVFAKKYSAGLKKGAKDLRRKRTLNQSQPGGIMIKRGDKGYMDNIFGMVSRREDVGARVIADDIKGECCLAIAFDVGNGVEAVVTVKKDGTGPSGHTFIPSKPWDSLKPTNPCFVRADESMKWILRIFAGKDKDGYPQVFSPENLITTWSECIPAILIDGELVPVEES